MGRQQYLERLALGRSAFEDPDTEAEGVRENETPRAQGAIDSDDGDGTHSEQQYVKKGRPTNPLTSLWSALLKARTNLIGSRRRSLVLSVRLENECSKMSISGAKICR